MKQCPTCGTLHRLQSLSTLHLFNILLFVHFSHLPLPNPTLVSPSLTHMADSAAISKFVDITGADIATASFFLSAAHGNVDAAVSTFFESDGIVPAGSAHTTTPSTRPAPRRPIPEPSPQNPPANPNNTSSSRPTRPPRSTTTGVATLAGLRADSEDDDKEANNYYAGGEKSGQMVQDPRRRGDAAGPSNADPPANLADAIFEKARQLGPRTDDEHEEFADGQTFTGAGYRLGDSNARTDTTTPPPPDVVGRRNVIRELTFYANGFTIDDGPLRRFDDPDNEAFLADVNRGVVPREMEEPGIGDVSITLIDKKGEHYVPRKKKVVPFSGGGQRLGATSGAAAAAASTPPAAVNPQQAAAAVQVNESRPIASVQIRLHDGTRLIARLNEDSTVGDLRQFVAAARPGSTAFTLSTAFPRKVLDDDQKTIKEAQLKGAVVLQTNK